MPLCGFVLNPRVDAIRRAVPTEHPTPPFWAGVPVADHQFFSRGCLSLATTPPQSVSLSPLIIRSLAGIYVVCSAVLGQPFLACMWAEGSVILHPAWLP